MQLHHAAHVVVIYLFLLIYFDGRLIDTPLYTPAGLEINQYFSFKSKILQNSTLNMHTLVTIIKFVEIIVCYPKGNFSGNNIGNLTFFCPILFTSRP